MLTVPVSECNGCTLPTDVDDCCEAVATWCKRRDDPPVVTFAGVPTIIGTWGLCENCYGCPENPPTGAVIVEFGSSLSSEQSASITVQAGISAGIPGLEASMSTALGAQVGVTVTVHGNCTISCEPCVQKSAEDTLTIWNGKAAVIDHTWSMGGLWGTTSECALWGLACPIPPPAIWSSPSCATGHTTGTATLVGWNNCSLTNQANCPGQ